MTRVRLAAVTIAVTALVSACDGYVEQATVGSDGAVSFTARATVSCRAELQREIWGDAPCASIDAVGRGEEVAALPFGFTFEPTRTAIVVDGDQDRRRIDVTWEGSIDELSTPLVRRAELRRIDESVAELELTPAGAPVPEFLASPGATERVREAGWPPAEFRIVAPELIIEHNADEINGRTVTWYLDRDRPETLRVRWDGDGPAIRYWWWLVGGSILVAVLFMMVSLEGSAGRDGHSR